MDPVPVGQVVFVAAWDTFGFPATLWTSDPNAHSRPTGVVGGPGSGRGDIAGLACVVLGSESPNFSTRHDEVVVKVFTRMGNLWGFWSDFCEVRPLAPVEPTVPISP